MPNRFDFGYGLSTALVDYAQTIQPDLIVTVDNGIASHEGVKRAHELGIKVVVTDHHLAADTCPKPMLLLTPTNLGVSSHLSLRLELVSFSTLCQPYAASYKRRDGLLSNRLRRLTWPNT